MTAPVGPEEWGSGEVYELADGTLPDVLDDYEGGAAHEPDRGLFERLPTLVALDSGGTLTAWAYFDHGPREGARPVPSGDYFEPT